MRVGEHGLRRMVGADLPAIQAMFERDPAFFMTTEGAPPRSDEVHRQLADEVPPSTIKHVFVVEDAGGSLVAFLDLLVGFPTATTWYLGLVFLAPDARGHGLGRRLLESLAAHAAAVGGTAVRLAVVVGNPARRLYDRAGFAFVARRSRTTWCGAVIEVDVLERAVDVGGSRT